MFNGKHFKQSSGIITNKAEKKYFSIAETSFKDRLRDHTSDFRNKKYINSTELSKYMWKLEDKKITPSLKWNIMSIVHGTPKGVFSDF